MANSVSVNCSKSEPPIAVLIVCEYLKQKVPVKIEWGDKTSVSFSSSNSQLILEGILPVSRYLAKLDTSLGLYGQDTLQALEVDSWLDFTDQHLTMSSVTVKAALQHVEKSLVSSSHLVGSSVSLADIAVWGAFHVHPELSSYTSESSLVPLVSNWYSRCGNHLAFQSVLSMTTGKRVHLAQAEDSKDRNDRCGKFIELPGAEMGKVVVRFPPEASGYLHIGHAKAALLNQYYRDQYKGKLIMRFDDTNPAKENAHFEEVILGDIKLLGLTPDVHSRTSDYFDQCMSFCSQLIKDGNGFVDDTPVEEMQRMREEKQPSKNRQNSMETNLALWQEMIQGTDRGLQCCVRAKIDYQSLNGCLRDPVVYRCKTEPHLVTGDKFKVYPTYDFACPIVDSLEGVTNALRTTEYHDRDDQYYWFIEKLGLRKVKIYDYSRLNLQHTLLSKRKLTWLVDNKAVDGWDDPRLPTVRGVLRRGMTVAGLREFIISQGSSKNVVNMEWDKIWACNKKVIDPVAPRYTALLKGDAVPCTVHGATESQAEYPLVPKDPSLGSKAIYYSNKVFLEAADAVLLKEGDTVTLINWGNSVITKVHREDGKIVSLEAKLDLDNKSYKDTLKLTWLSEHSGASLTPVQCVHFDHVITKPSITKTEDFKNFVNFKSKEMFEMLGDPHLARLKKGDIVQLQRRGFYICDEPYSAEKGSPCILFNIPDGHSKSAQEQSGSTKVPSENSGSSKTASVRSGSSKSSEKKTKHQDKTEQTTPAIAATTTTATITGTFASPEETEELTRNITVQAEKVRTLKTGNVEKSVLDQEIASLLSMKAAYKQLTGSEYKPTGVSGASAKAETKKEKSKPKAPANAASEKPGVEDVGMKKVTRLGLEARKEDNLSDWYTQIITKSELVEYYDISGCYILRPWAYSIWESIRDFFDAEIKKLGVENCYFPMFVSHAALFKEKAHIADFAPEVAWVTKSGNSDLAEPIAIRPTSETVMYPAFAKWIKSHRDLPLKLNQWCNVVRWEFKHPQPFLRTREFLWQEGHTAFSNYDEAVKEVYDILELYSRVYNELLAIPVIKGRKTEKEKFPGADFTTTVEAFIDASGRGIQGATSHHLGQNFSKMFDIQIEDPSKPDSKDKLHVYQNSWGLTTRTIGVLIMVHGDNRGLVLPPKVATIQVIVVPCGVTTAMSEEEKKTIMDSCENLTTELKQIGVRARSDLRENYSPGWKFNHWELKGVPLRIEIGPRDVKDHQFVAVRRDTAEKLTVSRSNGTGTVSDLLSKIQADLLAKATKTMWDRVGTVMEWKDFLTTLENKMMVLAPFCGGIQCEDKVKKDSTRDEGLEPGAPSMGAKSLCIPFSQPKPIEAGTKCVHPACDQEAKYFTLFGRSY